jgi:hypothetical protein
MTVSTFLVCRHKTPEENFKHPSNSWCNPSAQSRVRLRLHSSSRACIICPSLRVAAALVLRILAVLFWSNTNHVLAICASHFASPKIVPSCSVPTSDISPSIARDKHTLQICGRRVNTNIKHVVLTRTYLDSNGFALLMLPMCLCGCVRLCVFGLLPTVGVTPLFDHCSTLMTSSLPAAFAYVNTKPMLLNFSIYPSWSSFCWHTHTRPGTPELLGLGLSFFYLIPLSNYFDPAT